MSLWLTFELQIYQERNDIAPLILLNGCSSAGKTTLAMALQERLPEPYQYLSLDQFRDGFPERVRGLNAPHGSEGTLGLNVVPSTKDDTRLTRIELGPFGAKVLSGMRRCAAMFAELNIPTIVDDVVLHAETVLDYAQVLNANSVWVVGVYCDLEEVERRELARQGRFPGTAREHFDRVHSYFPSYDITVNTSKYEPLECADQVISQMQRVPNALHQVAQ